MFIRVIRVGFCFLLLGLCAASAAELTIVRVFSGWRDAASFKRISEYFDGKENTGGLTIFRTQPGERGGYYFLVRTANPGGPRAVSARLEIITEAAVKPTVHTFPLELKTGETTVQLGLTGSDWPDAKTSPVAWKLDLTEADGRVLVTEKSYLWEKPADK